MSSSTENSSTSAVSSVVVDTRVIGDGKGNPSGNLQDKKATTTTTTTTAVTTSQIETTNVYDVTTTVNSHRGAPISKGKALDPVVTTAVSTELAIGKPPTAFPPARNRFFFKLK